MEASERTMTDPIRTCPECGRRLHFSCIKPVGTRLSKRRDCDCGYADVVLLEIATIIEVAKRAKKLPTSLRIRKRRSAIQKNIGKNES
jgi:hypothetical protein